MEQDVNKYILRVYIFKVSKQCTVSRSANSANIRFSIDVAVYVSICFHTVVS